jgi:heme o synthase
MNSASSIALTRARLTDALDTLITLFKLRVVALLVFSSIAGAFVIGVVPDAGRMAVLAVAGALAAAGSSAVNEYIERDRDAVMRRTHKRPLPMSRYRQPEYILAIGLALIAAGTALSLLNSAAQALWVLIGAVVYVGVYTLWLKPRSVLNIVIGGFAGSAAVISGGAAVNAWAHPAVLLLGGLVFVWTPVHFWSLAMVYREDYQRAGFPMLPAQVSLPVAARWVALHTLFTGLAGLALAGFATNPVVYLGLIVPATLWLARDTVRLLRAPVAGPAMSLFKCSNVYLGIVLLGAMLAFV